MNEKLHNALSEEEKKAVITSVRRLLENHEQVAFAYLHGSFCTGGVFRDIDIALYIEGVLSSPLELELELESELIKAVIFPVDVRVLNGAPLSFRYNVIKDGMLLFARDDDQRAEFVEHTLSAYFDFAPYRNLYLKETLGIGV